MSEVLNATLSALQEAKSTGAFARVSSNTLRNLWDAFAGIAERLFVKTNGLCS